MAERTSRRSRTISVFAFVVGAVLAVGLALDLADHDVPLPLTIVAGGSLFHTVLSSLGVLRDRAGRTSRAW